jgi:ABC-2 type transport system ATP-binding protein
MIEVKHLTKAFGRQLAVDDVSFTIGPREVLGFLGPNAAGKSTTMRMITGFLPPTSGTAIIGGKDIVADSLSARRKMGYLPENAPTYPDMTVLGFLEFIAEIRGFSGAEKSSRIAQTIEKCFLSDVRYQTINTLSKGFNQRVCFAQSILHNPEYLIMDEPTDGLDPNQKQEVRTMIRRMSREKTIVLSTHNLEEVDAVCTRVIIIDNGKIVADDTPAELKKRSSAHGSILFRVRNADSEEIEGLGLIGGVDRIEVLGKEGNETTVRVYPKDTSKPLAGSILDHFLGKNCPVESLFVEEGRLDDVFRMITSSPEPSVAQ